MNNIEETTKTSARTKRLRQRLRSQTGRAIGDYKLIEPDDKVMVCLSGGKDSFTMLDILLDLQRHAPIDFSLIAVHLDQKQPGHQTEKIADFCHDRKVEFHCIEKDTYSIVTSIIPEGKTMCGLCSRLRRGNLYGFAAKVGASKIALGHHRNDIIETFFLNLFFGGSIKSMPVKLRSDSHHIVIRPLAYCYESDIIHFSRQQDYPIIPCNLCGSQDNLQRQNIKNMIAGWEKSYPGRSESIFRAMSNIKPSHMLDKGIFDFSNLDENQDTNDLKTPENSIEAVLEL